MVLSIIIIMDALQMFVNFIQISSCWIWSFVLLEHESNSGLPGGIALMFISWYSGIHVIASFCLRDQKQRWLSLEKDVGLSLAMIAKNSTTEKIVWIRLITTNDYRVKRIDSYWTLWQNYLRKKILEFYNCFLQKISRSQYEPTTHRDRLFFFMVFQTFSRYLVFSTRSTEHLLIYENLNFMNKITLFLHNISF